MFKYIKYVFMHTHIVYTNKWWEWNHIQIENHY